ncbi:MAG: 2-oxoglutarate dehydrogenase complex dihydrolipoyllysine-residue succinyltransferase [Thiohalocapsa sp.]|uniref:2-oxoglutarate dehydrogenase complex dihydrolipoyllysine-residue succinyltransferase n=1 Tax=Thiohalocapsa sp. TaxID=2497641 RepID=UPI0025FD1A6F|nr:2-oxoglutarate dehydrogenase complex dihydrolipoyllysine-residue succinyltransferase [Thiohalocapsa sp.]MCG6941378.1 2-oxoglutarate dehydrogenase complex dihydrolipoyllysine-residue succinyltransferase [Thiohalocapsa sp.]
MSTEVRVPALPESVADATVLTWYKQPGDAVTKDENLVDLETDKVVLEVPAPADGVVAEHKVKEGDVVEADAVLALIEAGAAAEASAQQPRSRPAATSQTPPAAAPAPAPAPALAKATEPPPLAPAARRLVKELGLDAGAIPGSGRDGRVHKADVVAWLDRQEAAAPERDADADAAPSQLRAEQRYRPETGADLDASLPALTGDAGRPEQRVPMTRLRARIAERLVEAQQTSAMLTTFNEVDMSAVMGLRSQYKDRFEQTHGVRMGFMSFFVKASVEALQRFPVVNASVDEGDIVYHGYFDIGIAVSSPRGLVVPILRNCDQLSMADIERGIGDFGTKAKEGTLSFEELTGGTFSITNGGVFGSLLSTPILNPPQSAILGMHKIEERPVARDGQVVIRPMMYLALSYDHRIIDGREAVQFLVTVKETLEDPARLLLRI